MVLTQGIFWLNFWVFLNHRGSSMNLGFQSIHRVLTREIPINFNDKKTIIKAILQKKKK
jgi:hypothetical protein